MNDLRDVNISHFLHTRVKAFNKYNCDGNPIALPDDAPVWFLRIDGVGMVTICKDDGMWMCEVTNEGGTGIAQSKHYDTAFGAWMDTRNQLLKMED